MHNDAVHMSLERLYLLIAKVLHGEASPEEVADFQLLIEDNREWKAFYLNIEEIWNSRPVDVPSASATEESYMLHLGRLKDRIHDFGENTENELLLENPEDFQLYPVKSPWYRKWQLYPAVLALFLVCFFSYRFFVHSSILASHTRSRFNEINVSPGTKTKIQLPDGSHVWVNSDSKLTYPETFKGTIREIFLDGEAYFDVVKDPAHPFIVHTSGIDIKVLGTAFNVKAYKAESTIEATLVHGLIELTKTNHPNDSKIILRPHEKLIFDKFAPEGNVVASAARTAAETVPSSAKPANPAITISPLAKNIADSAIIETSWIYNRLSVEDEKFEDLAVKIERWFNVSIAISSEKIKSYRISVSFENETIEEALKELQYAVPFNYEINGREIIIKKK